MFRTHRFALGLTIAVTSGAAALPAVASGDDGQIYQRVQRAADSHATALERIGAVPRRPPRGSQVSRIARRWAALHRAVQVDARDLRALVPLTTTAAATKSCALKALAALRAGAQRGRLAYRALSRGRIGTYRRHVRAAGRAHAAASQLRTCVPQAPAPNPTTPPVPTATPAPPPPPPPATREITLHGFSAVNYLAYVIGPVPSGGTLSACGLANELALEIRSRGIAPGTPTITWWLPDGRTYGPAPVRLLADGWGLPSIKIAQVDLYLPSGEYRVELAYEGTTLATGSVVLGC